MNRFTVIVVLLVIVTGFVNMVRRLRDPSGRETIAAMRRPRGKR